MWLNPVEFEVSVIDGVVGISGVIERRSHVEILIDLIRGVEGVVAVRPAVSYRLNDRNLAVSRACLPTDRVEALRARADSASLALCQRTRGVWGTAAEEGRALALKRCAVYRGGWVLSRVGFFRRRRRRARHAVGDPATPPGPRAADGGGAAKRRQPAL